MEGQTEADFVNEVLQSHFDDIELSPRIVITSKDLRSGKVSKGGITNYPKLRNNIKDTLRDAESRGAYVTTMIDFYRLPQDFPGYPKVKDILDPYQKVKILEDALKADFEDLSYRFFPYIQLHEFEALIFSDLSYLGKEYFEENITPLFEAIKKQPNPELINGGDQTSPSKRILQCIPKYKKILSGRIITENIGLEMLRKKCQHFHEWILKLEGLSSIL